MSLRGVVKVTAAVSTTLDVTVSVNNFESDYDVNSGKYMRDISATGAVLQQRVYNITFNYAMSMKEIICSLAVLVD